MHAVVRAMGTYKSQGITKEKAGGVSTTLGPHVGLESASGTIPITVVMVVSTIGRRRIAEESTTTSITGLLGCSFKWWIIESIRIIAWLMITPPSAMMPRIEVNESGWPSNARPPSTPISESGTMESR